MCQGVRVASTGVMLGVEVGGASVNVGVTSNDKDVSVGRGASVRMIAGGDDSDVLDETGVGVEDGGCLKYMYAAPSNTSKTPRIAPTVRQVRVGFQLRFTGAGAAAAFSWTFIGMRKATIVMLSCPPRWLANSISSLIAVS